MLSNIVLAGLIVVFIWLIIITFLFFQMSSHYNRLIKGLTNKTLKSVLENTLKVISEERKDIDYLMERCDKIEKEGLCHIQKIGLLRFNPFKDTGGDQSFIISLTDSEDTGVVISGLYSRSGTRWYAKRVLKGNGVDYELSDEEKKAIKETNVKVKNG